MTIERKLKYLGAISIFFSGATSLINEFVLSGLSSMILGNTFVMFSLTIGIMLFGTGVGSWAQKQLTDRFLINKFITLELTLAIIGSFAPLIIYGLFAYIQYEFVAVLNFLIFFIGFLIGFEIPLLIRITTKYNRDVDGSMSLIFSMDYFGAFVGTLLWVYFLLIYFPLTESSFIVASINLFFAVGTYLFYLKNKVYLDNLAEINKRVELEESLKINKVLGRDNLLIQHELNELRVEKNKMTMKRFIVLPIVVYSLLFLGYKYNRDLVIQFEQRMYIDPIVLNKTTKYQHLVVTKNKALGQYDFYINGNLQYSSLDKDRYHDLLIHPVMSLVKGKNVLIIGGGDGHAIKELKKYKDLKISLVDLDPEMIKLSQQNKLLRSLNGGAFDDINMINATGLSSNGIKDLYLDNNESKEVVSTVNVINIDASRFMMSIKDSKTKWDLVVIDLPDPSNPDLVKLYSKQFYMSVRESLSDEGLMVVQSTSPYHAKESFLCIGRTIKAAKFSNVLPYHINVPSFGDWGFYIGSKQKRNLKEELLSLKEIEVETNFLNIETLRSSLAFGKNELITKDKRINDLTFPILLDIYINNSWLKI